MAKNLIRNNTLRVNVANLAAAVTSGTMARQRGIIGIPINNTAAGETGAFAVNGLVSVTNSMGVTVVAGSNMYWDTTGAAISIGYANDDYYIGKATTGAVDGAVFDLLFDPNTMPCGQAQS